MHPLSPEVTSQLEALPNDSLIRLASNYGLEWIDSTARRMLGKVSLEEALTTFFPELPQTRIAGIARESALCSFRNFLWNYALASPGEDGLETRCHTGSSAELLRETKGPAIIAIWHHGATYMVPVGLQALGISALMVGARAPGDWFWRIVSRETQLVKCSDEHDSPLSLKAALDRLRKGGVVIVAADGRSGKLGVKVPFLGRMLHVAKGIGVLARLSGAPIIPALAAWGPGDWSVDFHLYDPLSIPARGSMPVEEWESEVMTATAKRFEAIVRAHPGQLRIDRIARLCKFPRIRRSPAATPARDVS